MAWNLASDFEIWLSKVGPTLDPHEKGLETELEAENRGNRYNFSWRIRIRGALWHMASLFRSYLLCWCQKSKFFAKHEHSKSKCSKLGETSFLSALRTQQKIPDLMFTSMFNHFCYKIICQNFETLNWQAWWVAVGVNPRHRPTLNSMACAHVVLSVMQNNLVLQQESPNPSRLSARLQTRP